MNKAELLAALASKYTSVLKVEGPQITGNVSWYTANVLDVNGDSARQQNVGFYVYNEGDPGEAAYWNGSEPKPTPSGTLTVASQVAAFIAAKIADNTIEGATVENIDETNVTAIVVAQMVGSGDLIEKRLFLDKENGVLRIRVIA